MKGIAIQFALMFAGAIAGILAAVGIKILHERFWEKVEGIANYRAYIEAKAQAKLHEAAHKSLESDMLTWRDIAMIRRIARAEAHLVVAEAMKQTAEPKAE